MQRVPVYPPLRQNGVALIVVLVFLLVIAALAALKGGEEIGEIALAVADVERRQVGYVAQAGMQRAIWLARRQACSGDFTVPVTALAADSYSASATGGGTTTLYTLPVDQDAWIRSDNTASTGGSSQHIRFENGKIEQALFRFDLAAVPPGAVIKSASAWFFVVAGQAHPEGPLTVHRVTADWTEAGANWDTMGGNFDAVPLAMVHTQPAGGVWVSVNLTAQVQAWVNGQGNFGLMLASASEGTHSWYKSREDATTPPRLEVVVGPGGASLLQINATGILDSGPSQSLYQTDVSAYQAPSGYEVTSAVGAGQDTSIYQDQTVSNFGIDPQMWVQDSGGGNGNHALLQFGFSGVPTTTRILRATVSLYQNFSATAGGTVGIHRLTRDWVEGSQNGAPGDGATWLEYDLSAPWSNPGGDYQAIASGETVIPSGAAGVGWHEWDITDLVDGWISGSYPNQGFMLTSAANGTEVAFATGNDPNSALHPKLSVTYACECGAACVAPQGVGTILLVVQDAGNLTAYEQSLQTTFEVWGYTVTAISQSSSNAAFDAAAAIHDMAYVAETANVGNKLTDLTIGVVSEQGNLNAELGFATGKTNPVGSTVTVVNNSHFVMLPFPTGTLEIYSADMEGLTISGTAAPGLTTLADWGGTGSLVVLDQGDGLGGNHAGESAAGRRVMLPLGRSVESKFTWNYLNNNGRLMVQRAIQWSAGSGGGTGGSSGIDGIGGIDGIDGISCIGTYRDEFNKQNFSGSDGTLTWAGDWLELGESDGATTGDIQVRNNQSNYQIRTRDNDKGGEGIEREADLTGAVTVTLSYQYRRDNLAGSGDYTAVEISANGAAGPWTELIRFAGPDNDNSYLSAAHDISAYQAANTRIRFKTSPDMGRKASVWFDDIQIECAVK